MINIVLWLNYCSGHSAIPTTGEENRWEDKQLLGVHLAPVCGRLKPEFRISDLDKATF